MVSLKTTSVVAAAALATLAQADYQIDPNTVSQATRERWCRDQKITCPLICQQTPPGTTLVNTCDSTSLQYGCLCGNNKQPNLTEYTLSMPYYVCTEWGNQCVKAAGNDNLKAAACRQDHPCGATDPQRSNASATASQSASKTSSNGGIYTAPPGSASNDGSSGSKNGGSTTIELGRSYGFAVLFAGMFAGFAML